MEKPDLGGLPIFNGLSSQALEFLQSKLEEKSFTAGQYLVKAGESADRFFLIAQGWVRLLSNDGREIARLDQGSMVGEADALSGAAYTITGQAVGNVATWSLPRSAIKSLITHYPNALAVLEEFLGFRPEVGVQGLAGWMAALPELRNVEPWQLALIARDLKLTQLELGTDAGSEQTTAFCIVQEGSMKISEADGQEQERQGCFLVVDRQMTLKGKPGKRIVASTRSMVWYLLPENVKTLQRQGITFIDTLLAEPEKAAKKAPVVAPDVVEEQQAPVLAPYVKEEQQTSEIETPQEQPRLRKGNWFTNLSLGGKLRLALVMVLIAWIVLAIAGVIPAVSALGQANAPTRDLSMFKATAAAQTPEALALNMPTATPTFAPSPTPLPTNTPTMTPTPLPPTPTEVPPTATATNMPTATPAPTKPKPTATATQALAQAAPEPTKVEVPAQPASANPPAATATPVPASSGVEWRLVSWRQLTACENHGMHNLFITVLDAAGNPIDGIPIRISWGDSFEVVSGAKGPGKAEFDMYKGGYTVTISSGTSDTTPSLHTDIGEDQKCDQTGNPVANSYGHYSYEVVFQRTR